MIHIQNGDLVAAQVKKTGLPGEAIVFRESLVTGAVMPGEDWLETRARVLAEGSDDLLRVRTQLLEQEQHLEAAAARPDEIILWFEHDLYCFIHLVHLLDRFRGRRVSMIWSPLPLSEKDDTELSLLFESRTAVTPRTFELAQAAWAAYASSDPTELNGLLSTDAGDFPFFREGVTLHASRFPSARNGLGAVEQQILALVADGAPDFSTVFDGISSRVPRYGFTDRHLLRNVRRLASCDVPLLSAAGEESQPVLALTPAGENVLAAAVNDLEINAPDFWLGGAHLTAEHCWLWTGERLERK